MRTQNIYRELTMRGKAVCALAGLLEEILIFGVLGLRSFACPALLGGFVVIFLWFLFAVLTGAAMIGVDEVWQMVHGAAHGAYDPAAHGMAAYGAIAHGTTAYSPAACDSVVYDAAVETEPLYAKAS